MASANVLMFCTGYKFKYPFLDAAQLGLDIQDHLVSPLYLFMVPPDFPSLFFIGVCKIICPFPHFDCQVSYERQCSTVQLMVNQRLNIVKDNKDI